MLRRSREPRGVLNLVTTWDQLIKFITFLCFDSYQDRVQDIFSILKLRQIQSVDFGATQLQAYLKMIHMNDFVSIGSRVERTTQSAFPQAEDRLRSASSELRRGARSALMPRIELLTGCYAPNTPPVAATHREMVRFVLVRTEPT